MMATFHGRKSCAKKKPLINVKEENPIKPKYKMLYPQKIVYRVYLRVKKALILLGVLLIIW
jgi:hypothetical protein